MSVGICLELALLGMLIFHVAVLQNCSTMAIKGPFPLLYGNHILYKVCITRLIILKNLPVL